MATFATLTTACRHLLQDIGTSAYAWDDSQIRRELDTAIAHWTRREGIADWLWVQAVARQRQYRLNAENLFLQQGLDDSGATGSLTTVTDSTVDFTTTVAVNDVVRNYTDGSRGIVTTVAATVLTCAAGFTGGIDNAVDDGDAYGVERPGTGLRIDRIETVLYDGQELYAATREQMDRLWPDWETRTGRPKYWLVDQADTPSVVTLVPAPLITGSSIPRFPVDVVPQRYEENLLCLIRRHSQQSLDALETIHLTDAMHLPIIYEAVARLSGFEGEWQNLALHVTSTGMAQLLTTLMEAAHG